MLSLLRGARLVVTDSGGLQEETAWFKVPTLVLRRSTPRWEGIGAGFATLVGLDVQLVLEMAAAAIRPEALARLERQVCPYGDGFTAERVARLLADPDLRRLIRPKEPDFVGETGAVVIDAVLLDLDDTCFDQREFLSGAFGAVARRAAGLGVDEARLRAALRDIAAAGSDRGGIIDRALATVGARVPVGPLVEEFRSYRPARLSPYPGVRESLDQMRRLAPVGLVTNGDPAGQRAKLAALDLHHAFDVVVFSDELGRSFRKPHPAPFCQALRLLGAEPAGSFFIGDHPDRDIAGAQHVGLRAIRVRTGEYASRPDVVTPWRTVPDAACALRILGQLARAGREEPTRRPGSR